MAGKGSKRRPCKNYSQYLENWDKAFHLDNIEFELKEYINNKSFSITCAHHVTRDLVCKFCGMSTSEILANGDSYTMEN